MPILKKALLVTTVSGFVPQFEMNNVRILQSMGYEVHYAANYHTPSYGNDNHRLDGTGIIRHQVDFVRSPFKLSNLTVYRQLCTLMKSEHFDLVHCHTPMGGVMARLAAHATGTGPVIYTAHGFHFFKGAAPVNWLCYYPMERFLSHFTDQQICINQEDYERASKQFHARYTDYIPGAGFDLNRIPPMTSEEIQLKKQALGLPLHCRILLSSGEFIKRKNHETTIRAFAKLIKEFPDIHYVICGHGQLQDYLQNLVKELGVTDHVSFPGYRQDMLEIYRCADIFAFPSFQEGLPMALLEAMASGLPVVCSANSRTTTSSGQNSFHFGSAAMQGRLHDQKSGQCRCLCTGSGSDFKKSRGHEHHGTDQCFTSATVFHAAGCCTYGRDLQTD